MERPLSTHALRRTGAGLLLLLALAASRVAAPSPAPRPAPADGKPADTCVFASRRPLEVPLRRINRAHRSAVRSMMEHATLVRRPPTRRFHSDMRSYLYLLNHLPISSKLSGLLGYGGYVITQVSEGRFHGKDYSGVEGDFGLAYADTGVRIFLGEGFYDSWYTPKISAKILLVVDFAELKPGEMATRIDIYVSTNRLIGYLMDLMGRVADKKLSELVSSAQYTSQMLSNYPLRVWARMTASGLFTPEELRGFKTVFLIPQHKAGSGGAPQAARR